MKRTAKKWIVEPIDEIAIREGCYFDPARGQLVVDFLETFCRQSKGRWKGEYLKLLDWQKSFIMRLYGWCMPDSKRRFRTAYLEVAKKNGKSTMVSGLACEGLLDPNDGAPEVYLNAVNREQASIIFDEAARMILASPELSEQLEVLKSVGRIIDPKGNGKIQKNSADAPAKDGVNASRVIFDEIHRFKNRDSWEIFEYAGESREEPLRIAITTAGEEEDGIWYEQRTYSEQVNAGVIPDIRHLGVVYRADPSDDIDDPATWRKANPSLGVTISEADFKAALEKAKQNPAELANFMRLRLNIITRGETAFVDLVSWDRCGDPMNPMAGWPCFMGLDLSENQDLTALACVFPRGDLMGVLMRFWLPEANILALERQHQVPYRVWAGMGLITLTPGNSIDDQFIRREIVQLSKTYDLRKLLMDPYHGVKLGSELLNQDGLPVETIRQGFLSLADPTSQLQRLIVSGKLRHGGNPILRWHAANTVVEIDAAGNMKLTKKKSKKKIDGMAALVNAIAGATGESVDDGASVYETRGLIFLNH